MKCLSLWQPWATLWAIGAKRFETRSWRTAYRGPLAIHAAKTSPYDNYGIRSAIRRDFDLWAEALKGQVRMDRVGKRIDLDGLPRGVIVGHGRMVDCVPTDTIHEVTQLHRVGQLRPMVGKLLYEGHSDHVVEAANKGPLLSEAERLFGNFSTGRFGFLMSDVVKLEKPIEFKGQQGFFDVPDSLVGLIPKE